MITPIKVVTSPFASNLEKTIPYPAKQLASPSIHHGQDLYRIYLPYPPSSILFCSSATNRSSSPSSHHFQPRSEKQFVHQSSSPPSRILPLTRFVASPFSPPLRVIYLISRAVKFLLPGIFALVYRWIYGFEAEGTFFGWVGGGVCKCAFDLDLPEYGILRSYNSRLTW